MTCKRNVTDVVFCGNIVVAFGVFVFVACLFFSGKEGNDIEREREREREREGGEGVRERKRERERERIFVCVFSCFCLRCSFCGQIV